MFASDTEISCILIGLHPVLPPILQDPKLPVMFQIVILMNIHVAVSHIAVLYVWQNSGRGRSSRVVIIVFEVLSLL